VTTLLSICLTASLLALLALWWRLDRLVRAVNRLRGELVAARRTAVSQPVTERVVEPVASAAQSINAFGMEMERRLRVLRNDVNQLQALLSSMVEGVIAVDLDDRVIRFNAAAGDLLGVDPFDAVGRSLQEVIRNSALLQLISEAEQRDRPVVGEIVLRREREEGPHYLQAQAAGLLDAADERIGALVVLHDITRLRKLEIIRRDFVANVSHELKTPVTAIKGFVETLLDDPDAEIEDKQRFLEILNRQANRLHALVEDLLTLARLEDETSSGKEKLALERSRVRSILLNTIEDCTPNAEARGIVLHCDCDEQLTAMAHSMLLEQAVTNLVDNAVKYSPDESNIWLSAHRQGREVFVNVRDEGPGIEPEHQARLFERFYRIDRGRSRDLGGTGLGLSIVKYIAQAHGGRVSVQSQVGRGSTFTLTLRAPDHA